MLTKKYRLHSLKLTAKAPEILSSQKESSLPTLFFEGRAVSFRGSTSDYLRDDSIIISDLRIHSAKMGGKNHHQL